MDMVSIETFRRLLLNAIEVESHQQNGLYYIQKCVDLNEPGVLYYLGLIRREAIYSYENKEEAFCLFAKAASHHRGKSIFVL
jgi:hypothetical protein